MGKSKRQSKSKAGKKSAKSKRRNCGRGQTKSQLTIKDLPQEILERVMKNLNVKSCLRIRSTCQQLKMAHDDFFLHGYRALLRKIEKPHDFRGGCWNDSGAGTDGKENRYFEVIHQSTWAFAKTGILPLFMRDIVAAKTVALEIIGHHLKNYYELCKDLLGGPLHQKFRLIYVVTLLTFLNAIENSIQISSTETGSTLSLIYEMKGTWMGLLWSISARHSFKYPSDSTELLVILAEIMASCNERKAFRKVWERHHQILVYGNDMPDSGRIKVPNSFFTFEIMGSQNVIEFLKNAPNIDDWKNLPEDDFTVDLRIDCNEALKWGCLPNNRFKITRKGSETSISNN